jgi:hypothetical protein
MPAVVTTKTLSAWRAWRTSCSDQSLPRRHTEAEQEKGRFRPARLTPATLGTPPRSVRLRGECIADIAPDFTPFPRFITPISSALLRFSGSASLRKSDRGSPNPSRGSKVSGGGQAASQVGPSWEWTYLS